MAETLSSVGGQDVEINLLLLPEERKRTEVSRIARDWTTMLLQTRLREPIQWARDTYDKPFLASHPHTHVNLAHSGRMVLFAVAEDKIGVDVEFCRVREYASLAKRYFHPREQAWASLDWAERFYDIWTAKEAYLKAIGIGIRTRLSSFSMIDENGYLHSPDGGWHLFPLHLSDVFPLHKACVCTRGEEIPPAIDIWEMRENRFVLSQKIDKKVWSPVS